MDKIKELQNSIDGLEITVNNLISENEKLKATLRIILSVIKPVSKYLGE